MSRRSAKSNSREPGADLLDSFADEDEDLLYTAGGEALQRPGKQGSVEQGKEALGRQSGELGSPTVWEEQQEQHKATTELLLSSL